MTIRISICRKTSTLILIPNQNAKWGGLYSPHFCRGDPWGISEQNVKREISGSHGGQYEF
jgi:hypothetical protein